MIDKALKKKEISKLINASFRLMRPEGYGYFCRPSHAVWFFAATRAGISIAVKDMLVPPQKEALLAAAEAEVKEISMQYISGLATDGERYNKVVDIWGRAR